MKEFPGRRQAALPEFFIFDANTVGHNISEKAPLDSQGPRYAATVVHGKFPRIIQIETAFCFAEFAILSYWIN
jgi:hypothetical protein